MGMKAAAPNDYAAAAIMLLAEECTPEPHPRSMRLLYVMSSGDQWEMPMYVMMGASEPGRAPARNDFSLYAIFPIAWMFLGFVFAINLFVGVGAHAPREP